MRGVLHCPPSPRPGSPPNGWADETAATVTGDRRQAQPLDRFDEAALFYGSLLGLRAGATQELAGPGGLIRSRALADPAGAVRVVLNMRAVGDDPGHHSALMQHVAVESTDARASARLMRDRGVPLLRMPGNYYDDLADRFDLDVRFTAELRSLGVLYDRSGDGELLHFYTTAVGGHLCFEVVERIGGYHGYGAANSPVRLAAQAAASRAAPAQNG